MYSEESFPIKVDGQRVMTASRLQGSDAAGSVLPPEAAAPGIREVLTVADDGRVLERLGLSRREFLALCGWMTGAGIVGSLLPACTEEDIKGLLEQIASRPVRRDISNLEPNDPILASYGAAITAMKDLPSSDRRNWTRQAEIHRDICRHRSWLFFPWHRAYLFAFEQICRELSGDAGFALPYWNWTANPQVPAVFWDTASPLFHPSRGATASSTANPASVGQSVIDNILLQTNFLIFAGQAAPLNDTAQFGAGAGTVEGTPHNYIHGFVGGTMGGFLSPLDPIFWTHHNKVDELWVEWNIIRGHPNTNASDWTQTVFTDFAGANGDPIEISVFETILYPLLSYRFDTQT
jgi:tyrosinase